MRNYYAHTKGSLMLFMISFGLALFFSCTKLEIEGCTDSTASNYSSSATKDDGSCTYPNGDVMFWSQTGTGISTTITVTFNNATSAISKLYIALPPCASSGTANFSARAGTYSYTATDGTSNWNGTATVTSGICNSVRLFK